MSQAPSGTYDLVILGGGPAGLGLAQNVASLGLSTLLLEKNKLSTTRKTWLTFDYILDKYRLRDAVRNRFDKITLQCYLGNSFSFKDTGFLFPIQEEKALTLLAEAAVNHGAELRDGETFVNYRPPVSQKEGVIIRTDKGEYRSRVAVDAMGADSPVFPSLGRHNTSIMMGCLAYILEGVTLKENELILYDSFFPGPDYFWWVPLEPGKLVAGLFFFDRLTEHNMREKVGKLREYLKIKGVAGTRVSTRFGNIPLGSQQHLSHGNLLCLGDSANTALPSSGFSFNRCLDESEQMSRFLQRYFSGKADLRDYKRELLASRIPGIEVHWVISDMLSKFTDPMLNKAIGAMKNFDESFIVNFLNGRDMSVNFSVQALRAILTTFTLSELRTISLKQNYLRNLSRLYSFLPSLSHAKLGNQVMEAIRSFIIHEKTISR